MAEAPLPIEALRADFLAALEREPVVVSAPTGSGKSTQLPRWCAARGRVLVVEPRRVACRSLAQRVAELEGVRLGGRVGYTVRDERRAGADSQLVYATPGVVLRWLAGRGRLDFDIVVIDEFHERGLETDLLLALLQRRAMGLVVMSATLAGRRLARQLDGVLLEAEQRAHPVEHRYLAGRALLPDPRGLEERVAAALAQPDAAAGDVLVFLPGKAEIAGCARRLAGSGDFELLALHGGLSLAEQSRVFAPAGRRRVVLATNVAETSLTIPGIAVVIDSGLVRRTRRFNGRSFLSLAPIAADAAAQRAGRAGRTGPGVCYRLWSAAAILTERTPPAIHREDLTELVLAAAACGARPEALDFVDPPAADALAAAEQCLRLLGALDAHGGLTERGRGLFGLPIDAALGNLLFEAESRGCLEAAIDLAAVLAADRPLFSGAPPAEPPPGDPRADGCDGLAFIRTLRAARAGPPGVQTQALADARGHRRRLREAFGLPGPGPAADPADERPALLAAALASDPRTAYVPRRRRGRIRWANGGPEIELARSSAVDAAAAEALCVLATFGHGSSTRDQRIAATCAMPARCADLAAAGIGRERVAAAERLDDAVAARIERVHAGRVIASERCIPRGALARRAAVELFLRGTLFADQPATSAARLERAALFCRLRAAGLAPDELDSGPWRAPVPGIERWAHERLAVLGFEDGGDLALLTADDLLAPELPAASRAWLDRQYPATVSTGDARFACRYDPAGRSVELVHTGGRLRGPPTAQQLPRFGGLTVRVRQHSRVWVVRDG
jgi:ATP-dependent helicase HrpB